MLTITAMSTPVATASNYRLLTSCTDGGRGVVGIFGGGPGGGSLSGSVGGGGEGGTFSLGGGILSGCFGGGGEG